MKKSDSKSFQKTLGIAATMAALGASLGVPAVAHDAEATNIKAGKIPRANESRPAQPKKQGAEASQLKQDNNQRPATGASQLKTESRQIKLDRAR